MDWRIKLKTNKTFAKDQQEKLEIKIIRTKLENIIFVNWDWRIKLEINKTSTKWLWTKNRNQTVICLGGKRKEEK